MNKENYTIVPLPKEQWKNTVIPMRYTAKEYDFPDKLYQDHQKNAYAWGILEEIDGKQELTACIETCPEEWTNRLIITELWVHEKFRRKGIGHALVAIAKEQACLEHRRAIILEIQSCNAPAVSFYMKEGFEPVGFNSCCHPNRDPDRKEVRLDLGYFPRKSKVRKEDIVIRAEKEDEYHKVEQIVLQAFWNKHRLGCNEHLLVHKLRKADVYVPQISRIAEVNGEIAGVICFAKAMLQKGGTFKEILMFGPLCVKPEWQGCGIGGALLEETLKLAEKEGGEGVVIFGEPDYYPLHGFKTCDQFGITTKDGKNFDAFMGIELVKGGLSNFGGKFIEPAVFEELSEEENEEFTKGFDAPAKQRFPCQWE